MRLEEFLDDRWGTAAPGTYNVNLSIIADFFLYWQRRGRILGNPAKLIERARKRDVPRTVFTSHDRPPCFVCEKREAEPGQILCRVCLEWAEAKP